MLQFVGLFCPVLTSEEAVNISLVDFEELNKCHNGGVILGTLRIYICLGFLWLFLP